MTKKSFAQLRYQLDDAITFAQYDLAREIIVEGLNMAHYEESLGELMYFRAQHAILEQDYQEAIYLLGLALDYNPADGAAYNDRALCIIDSGGSTQQALENFDKGIEVEPDYATVYHNKGWYLNQLGHSKEAIQYFHKTLELEPNRVVTYENLADTYSKLGERETAIQAYQKALELLGNHHPDIKRQIKNKIFLLSNSS